MKKRVSGRVIRWLVAAAVVAVFALWMALSGGVENYSAKYAGADLTAAVEGIGRDTTYARYLTRRADAVDASADVEIDVLSAAPAEGVEARAEGLYTANGSTATWTVNVPQSGYYNLRMRYLTVASRGVDMERAVYINGELPFDGADRMLFTRLWTDSGEVRKDNQGNEIRPTQAEVFDWQEASFKDAMGYITEPYRFYLEQGENQISLKAVSEPMIIGGLTLAAPATPPSYEKYVSALGEPKTADAAAAHQQTLQGEAAYLRSSPSLYAKYDRASAGTEPYDVYHTVLNYIGGDSWRNAGQWVEWRFTVPEDGWYTLTVKARQNHSRGSLACRSLYIDGEIPFAEVESIPFAYSTSWESVTIGDENGVPYRFYLTAGDHTLRLEATMGEMGGILSGLDESIYRLNQIYRRVLVLTGATPDRFRDYRLQSVYPDAIDAMALESKILYKLVDEAIAVTGQKSDRMAVAQTLAVQLERFVKDPDKITVQFQNFKDNITSLGTAMQALSETKLDIDLMVLSGTDAPVKIKRENFFDKAEHEIRSCLASLTVDYNALGNVYEGQENEVIEVWIMTGRDQSTILKTMVDDTFTPETGIMVNVKLVDPNALLNAVVAGNGPDVVVSTDTWNPVNYALRHSVEDLRQFPDADEVLKDFYPSAYRALEFEGGLYALPETQLCNVLFYREDILDEYGLTVPETWEELLAMLPTIQGANMSMGIPYPDIVAPNLATYYAMLYQNGGTIYNDNATHTTIGSEAGVKAFEMYTSLYNDYGFPTVFDFISRFRSGEMPMGIYDYTVFNTLTVSAPEIRGLWNIAVIPGTEHVDENGKTYIDHSGHSQGACCMMIATKDEALKQKCWEFMKWWVSTDAQVRFGRELESVLGASARYATANIAAVEQMAWSEEQLTVIREQMRWAVGFQEVAGGYYTNRHLTNAVRKVVNEKTDQRETILDYARTIDEEIVKKRDEFGLPLE